MRYNPEITAQRRFDGISDSIVFKTQFHYSEHFVRSEREEGSLSIGVDPRKHQHPHTPIKNCFEGSGFATYNTQLRVWYWNMYLVNSVSSGSTVCSIFLNECRWVSRQPLFDQINAWTFSTLQTNLQRVSVYATVYFNTMIYISDFKKYYTANIMHNVSVVTKQHTFK